MSDSNIPAEPTLTGARVQLRPLRASDADDLFAVHSDPRVMRYWSHVPWTDREQAAARIAQLARDRANAEFYTWALTLADDRLIGTVSLFAINRMQRRAEVGYALAARAWGHGYASEGLSLAIAHAFGVIGLERLEADIDPRNEASERTLLRLGFVKEGYMRERWIVADVVSDSAVFGLLRREWTRP